MSDKYQKMSEYFQPKYDSDEDLDEETKKKIKEQENTFNYNNAEATRTEGWEKADIYPKIKRFVKGAFYGDKRKPKE